MTREIVQSRRQGLCHHVPAGNAEKSENSKSEPGLSGYYKHAFVGYQNDMWATMCILV